MAIVIGAPPVVEYTYPQKLRTGVDELAVAGGLVGKPIRLQTESLYEPDQYDVVLM